MMQTLNPYNTAKTAEIMARYRPIAPKPENPASPNDDSGGSSSSSSSIPQGIRKSAYLMNVWNNLQARPTRTRKRGRTALGPPPTVKRTRTCLQGLFPPPPPPAPAQGLTAAAQTLGFVHDPTALPSLSFFPNLLPLKCGLETAPVTTLSNAVSLPLMPGGGGGGCAAVKKPVGLELFGGGIDLNRAAAADVPQEVDFVHQLESPKKVGVISPQAVRPVGSSITVGVISDEYPMTTGKNPEKRVELMKKKPEEVEKEMEFEELPAVVTDSNNKVRLTNAAYNEMVGQPECPWLDFTAAARGGAGACKRIGGEVVMDLAGDVKPRLSASNPDGFGCWVRIEWGKDGKKNVVNAHCDVIRLACESKDYLFEWRFHIREASESSGSNV
ncbi:OLC1v1017046C1 [Oldenlandia corymbosa var. corymbosa]|uniref:OLC1v1017046C1 n=1 Tax=Oldenlandia corymbosa var. corymbosa TaxID=529605 RepID=A0AAV1E8J9_OLDCO|nr:OLC1v1017046C1 [Oldenlandia corymbosa var. corymbosa]